MKVLSSARAVGYAVFVWIKSMLFSLKKAVVVFATFFKPCAFAVTFRLGTSGLETSLEGFHAMGLGPLFSV
jgi:hypothetical protein